MRMNRLRIFIPIALIIILPLASPASFVHGQPQGYTLIYSPPRGYQVDWMDVKAFYMKEEENRLYFYVEYYDAIPNSGDYERHIYVEMDTDRNPQTGVYEVLGLDYYIVFCLRGDNSYSYAILYKWDSTSNSWNDIKDLKPNMRQAPGLNYMEIWVDKWDIGYTPNGIDFYIESDSDIKAIPSANLSYVVGSSVKQITVDGEPGDWGSIAQLKTFPSRGINPPELEASSIYVANDDENLYFRLDARGKPSTAVNAGDLYRDFYVYVDADNNGNTGYIRCGGAEFKVYAYAVFSANLSKSTWVDYYRYTWTGSDWDWQEMGSSSNSSDFNNVFEFKIPLSLFGLRSGRTVGIYIEEWWWRFGRWIPRSSYLTYPPALRDTIPPVTAIDLSEPEHQVGSTTYVSGSTTFTFSASDASGVRETKYRIDGAWTTYSSGFTLSEFSDGSYTISYYSVDNAGNTEAEKTLTITLDKTPPAISDASPTGTVGSTSVTFSVKVEDSGSGVKEARLIVDGASKGAMSRSGNTYTMTVSLSEGSHTWIVEAVDNVGNSETQNYSITISTWVSLLPYLIAIAIVIAIIIAAAAIMLRRRRAPLPPPPPPPP
jgi:hypothetical protein